MVGIDADRVTAWFGQHLDGVEGPLEFDLIAGGRSNLTFKVTDKAGGSWVLRRPPIGHVLPTAHDMGREHRLIAALGPTSVPVAPALALCTDLEVNGAPFYVMGYVDGHVLRDVPTVERTLGVDQRRRAGEALVDVLADLHAVDIDSIGLGDLAKREAYIERQLKRWYGQFKASTAETGRVVPEVDEVHDFLASRIPAQGPATLVHGDYRLDNTMFDDQGEVLAVLDWEICTLGDPMADLGLLMVYWSDGGDDPGERVLLAPTACPGFPTKAELRARYAQRSGRDVGDLDFFISFGYWKLACILEGVYTRYAGGSGGGDNSSHEGFAAQVGMLAGAAKAAAANL